MLENENTYISLDHLSARLGLPRTYLKQLAERRSVPFLRVSGRMKFDPERVKEALDRMAANEPETSHER